MTLEKLVVNAKLTVRGAAVGVVAYVLLTHFGFTHHEALIVAVALFLLAVPTGWPL